MNIVDIETGLALLTSKPFDAKEFGFELIEIFAKAKATIARLREKNNSSDLPNGIIWKQHIHYAPSEKGATAATLERLKQSKQTAKQRARFLFTTDGQDVLVSDRLHSETLASTFGELKDEAYFFLPLIGQEGYRATQESSVDIKATAKLAKLYDALVGHNPDWLSDEKRHALNHFMTQLIFCFFAEDTHIFPSDIFSKTVNNRSGANGEHATEVIKTIFGVLDKRDGQRSSFPSWSLEFPYVNGGLFSGDVAVPEFNAKAFRYLLEATRSEGTKKLNWQYVNPDILGSSIQAIVDPEKRRDLGMHYTSVPNILKTLDPLFLNDLRKQLFEARSSKKKIDEFMHRLRNIKIADFACGSGNFLVIAYRELRKLEVDALDALKDLTGKANMEFAFSSISLNNFYGIEYADFAAETAKLALWIAEYQANRKFEAVIGIATPALPLRDSGHIICKNALSEVDWSEFCPLSEDDELYLVSNPPYLGASGQNSIQKKDMDHVFKGKVENYKSLDYVCAWFFKAAEYCNGKRASFAFVATNSIVQGGHVSTLWPMLFDLEMVISFAYSPFVWKNNAADNAGVTCVIIGVQNASSFISSPILITNLGVINCKNINPFLIDAPNIFIKKAAEPINGLPSMDRGNSPVDGGHLILSEFEVQNLLEQAPLSKKFIYKYVGSQELIKGLTRYCLWINDDSINEAKSIPLISERLVLVAANRMNSRKEQTRLSASFPHRFGEIRQYHSNQTIVVPRVSSENRPYLPVDILSSGQIINDSAFAIYDAPIWAFSIICSKLHLLWIATVCGKLRSDFRYSNLLGWNTFPVPLFKSEQKEALENTAKTIIHEREFHFPKTIADLYDSKKMPLNLKAVHEESDRLLESFYRDKPFESDQERLKYLFDLYEKMIRKDKGDCQ